MRKGGLTDESTVTARAVVVTTLSREVIGVMAMSSSWEVISVRITVITLGVVKVRQARG